jgi:hypothetical protein
MSFRADIARFTAETEKAADEIVRGVTIGLFTAVIKDTPVDTGRARGEWQTTTESPAQGENGREDKSGGSSIAEVIGKTPQKAGGETLLTNNLPYIEGLEYGNSKQAPAGMVRKNLARITRLVRVSVNQHKV